MALIGHPNRIVCIDRIMPAFEQKKLQRPNISIILFRRIFGFPIQIWRNLGTNSKYRVPKFIGYSLGGLSFAYSFVSLFYALNMDLNIMFALPFYSYFSEHIVPFVAKPFVYIGIDISNFGKCLLTISSVGGVVLANADFRTKFRLTKYIFLKKEDDLSPRFDRNTFKEPPKLEPQKTSFLNRTIPVIIALLLGYSFLGLLGFLLFIPFGLYFLWRDTVYIAGFIVSQILYIFEYLLAPFERWGEDEYWGTKWFLAFYRKRRALDEFIERSRIEFWRVRSLDLKKRSWTAAQGSVADGGRVIANGLWILLFALIVSGYSNWIS